jgi:hypothetical protein
MICVTNWDYFEIIMPPIPINQFLAGDYPDFPEVFTADLLAALARSGNSEVPEFLLNGLCTLFERDVAACVSLGDWFLDRLPDFIARPNLAFLAILTASHAFKHAQLARPEQAIGMIESLLRDDSDDLVEVGLKLAATVVARWQLPALDGTTIIPAVIGLVNEGSFRVKVAGLRALNVFMSACEFARFKEFVAPEILDLVFSFFNDEGGHTAGDHGVVAILMKMMVTILERFIFTEPDAENLRGMTPMYHVLRSLTTEKDPEIANSAAAILARLGPYWIECFTGDNSEK